MSVINVDAVERTVRAWLEQDARPVIFHDAATGEQLQVSVDAAASPSGLLPTFIVAGETVWREATGKGFGLDVVRDPDALLGYRLRGIGAGSFATVMLAALEATAQASRPDAILCHELNAVWSAATGRIAQKIANAYSPAASPSP